MEIGKMITGSSLIHTEKAFEKSTSVQDRSNNHEQSERIQLSNETVLNKGQLSSIVDGLNSFLKPTDTSIKYELHEKLDRYYVTLVDRETDEIIKEIPPKKMLDVYASIAELMGFIVDKKI